MSNKLLLKDLIKFRAECIYDRDSAANPGPYLEESDYDNASGREIALDEVIDSLNKLINEHS